MLKRIFLLCIIIYSCHKNESFNPVYNVPAEFDGYVKTFEKEAAARGMNITINNLIIKYDSALTVAYCANSNVTSSANDVQKIISINARVHCAQNNMQLETLIFHELGHCVLGRQHDKSKLPNGDAKSIMYPDDLTMYSPCVYNLGDTTCNHTFKRKYYIDELFNSSTPVPHWAK